MRYKGQLLYINLLTGKRYKWRLSCLHQLAVADEQTTTKNGL